MACRPHAHLPGLVPLPRPHLHVLLGQGLLPRPQGSRPFFLGFLWPNFHMSGSYPDTTYSPTPHTPQGLKPPSLGCPRPIHLLHTFCCVAWRAAGACLPRQAVHKLLDLEAWDALIFISQFWNKQLVPESWVLRERFYFRPGTIQGPCMPKSCIQCCLFLGFGLRMGRHPRCMAWRPGASSPG